MVSYNTPIEVWNAALIRCGESSVTENDDSAYSELFRAAYEGVVNDYMTRQRLLFAKKTHTLVLQGETGNFPKYAYPLPSDYLLAHKVTKGETDQRVEYEVRSGKVLASVSATDLLLHYTFRAKENAWPGDFSEAVLIKMRSIIKAFDEDDVESERLDRRAEGLMLDSIARHRLAQTAPPHTPSPRLVNAWRGGRRHA